MITPRTKERFVDWQAMYDTLASHLIDMPQFTADHKALGDVLAQARDLEKAQDTVTSQLRDINQQRRTLIQQGKDLRSRLGFGLKGVLGQQNEKLIEFGVKPRARTRRKKAQPIPEPGSPGPAA